MAKIRLDKFIADCGCGTRSQAKKLIKSKKVTINGQVITDDGFKIEESSQDVAVCGNSVQLRKFVYFMLNKPAGVISATEDKNDKTVIDLLSAQDKAKGIFPVGRLDKDTEGLLILTNDGEFAHNTLSPRKHISKKYFVRVENYTYTDESAEDFRQGIVIDGGYKCQPAVLEFVEEKDAYTSVTLEISEGKFHQVKRMFAAVGGKVVFLKRIAFGGLLLDNTLKPGEYRQLNSIEMNYIKNYSKNAEEL